MEQLPHYHVAAGCWEVAAQQSASLMDLIPIELNSAISAVLVLMHYGLDLHSV